MFGLHEARDTMRRMAEPRTVSELLDTAELVMSDSSHIFDDHDNRHEAIELMAHVLDVDEDDLDMDEVPSGPTRNRFLALAARRAAGEPFPFLVGHIEFFGLDLKVRPGPFVPRPSSELTVERALKRLKRKRHPIFVDVATGAGPIALAVAAEMPQAEVWGIDIDEKGIAQGRENARLLDIDNARFKVSDMYGSLPARLRGNVDVISGHVPYVPADELEDLPREVRGFEPVHTLSDQTADGLFLMRRAIDESVEWLKPGGWLLLEVSDDLIGRIKKLAGRAGFEHRGVADDEDGLSIVVESQLRS
jgi:release factor glutamine methyltransferase